MQESFQISVASKSGFLFRTERMDKPQEEVEAIWKNFKVGFPMSEGYSLELTRHKEEHSIVKVTANDSLAKVYPHIVDKEKKKR